MHQLRRTSEQWSSTSAVYAHPLPLQKIAVLGLLQRRSRNRSGRSPQPPPTALYCCRLLLCRVRKPPMSRAVPFSFQNCLLERIQQDSLQMRRDKCSWRQVIWWLSFYRDNCRWWLLNESDCQLRGSPAKHLSADCRHTSHSKDQLLISRVLGSRKKDCEKGILCWEGWCHLQTSSVLAQKAIVFDISRYLRLVR